MIGWHHYITVETEKVGHASHPKSTGQFGSLELPATVGCGITWIPTCDLPLTGWRLCSCATQELFIYFKYFLLHLLPESFNTRVSIYTSTWVLLYLCVLLPPRMQFKVTSFKRSYISRLSAVDPILSFVMHNAHRSYSSLNSAAERTWSHTLAVLSRLLSSLMFPFVFGFPFYLLNCVSSAFFFLIGRPAGVALSHWAYKGLKMTEVIISITKSAMRSLVPWIRLID